jgi:GT2 family glycosyltransferase
MVRESEPCASDGAVIPKVTVVVPTLNAGASLAECIESLRKQSLRDFEVMVVDNSGKQLVQPDNFVKVIPNNTNVGFGAAINQAFHLSRSPYLATLNDDATAHPLWLESLFSAIDSRPDIGMCASQVRLAGDGRLDSAGMLLCADGSSKQRGHLDPPENHTKLREALCPSGSAALYRREMLEEIGLFDESFFLYCEDTDLGLRARWAGWECLYVPDAVVEHRYSHSAGRASALKAFYVERNRLFLIAKNFPLGLLARAPFQSLVRYFWHAWYSAQNRGVAGQFRSEGNTLTDLAVYVLRAHIALLRRWPALWSERRRMKRRLTTRQFCRLARRFSISARQVAAL